MRRFPVLPLSAMIACGALVIFAMTRAPAQMAPAPQPPAGLEASLLDDLVAANRVLAQKGVLDALGHVSVRDPHDPNRYWMSRSLAPALVTPSDIMEFDLDSNAIDRQGRPLYVERFIHGEIYKARPDVNAIVHSHSPTVIPFSVTKVPLQPVLHNASFLAFGAPIFDTRTIAADSDLLIRTPAFGAALAKALGSTAAVVLLRGHGDAVVASSLPDAVFRAYYTEVNAREQEQAIALGGKDVVYITPEEAATREKESHQSFARAWELWKREAMVK
jgi:ribulose-5-phosphate 4-epimerase/fuculose-1-phosphate aldolase